MPKVARLVFYLALAFTFLMAALPHPPQLPGQPSDKVQHIVAFAVLSALASAAYSTRSWWALLAGLGIFGALIELAQAIPALNRDSDLVDLLADLAASFVVLMVIEAYRMSSRRSSEIRGTDTRD